MKSKALLMVPVGLTLILLSAKSVLAADAFAPVDSNAPGYPGGPEIQPPPAIATPVSNAVPELAAEEPEPPNPEPRALPVAKLPLAVEIRALLEKFADVQLAADAGNAPDWQQALLLSGAMALDGCDASQRFRNAVRAVGDEAGWKAGENDQNFCDAWLVWRDPKMIAGVRAGLDGESGDPKWQDTVAMLQSAPTWARMYAATGQKKYRDALVAGWKDASKRLFDPADSLFRKETSALQRAAPDAPHVYDGLANGCALAGLARALQHLPENDKARSEIAEQFAAVARKLVDLRLDAGGWGSAVAEGETNAPMDVAVTALIAFGLVSGINQGLIKAEGIEPVVAQAWAALGEVVQPVEKKDRVAVEPTKDAPVKPLSPHAGGALLLTGAELFRLALVKESGGAATVRVANLAAFMRTQETFEVPWDDFAGKANMATSESITLFDAKSSRMLDTQMIDLDGNGIADSLLAQSDFLPGETKTFIAVAGVNRDQQPLSPLSTFGRFVPERLDDFAWENDRIAFRVYGPALLKESGAQGGSGIDVWCKRVRSLVIDKWYASDDYAEDKGEGCDFYRVGQTRGSGGSGIIANDRVTGASDFATWKILANGPIRTVFELTYPEWKAYIFHPVETNADVALGPDAATNELVIAQFKKNVAEKLAAERELENNARKFGERKLVSLDRGANFNKIVSTFEADDSGPFTFVSGIASQPGDSRTTKDEKSGWLAYTTPDAPPNGRVHSAVIADAPGGVKIRELDGHNVVAIESGPGQVITYYSGAAWSKGLDFTDHASWVEYVNNYAARLASPLKVRVK